MTVHPSRSVSVLCPWPYLDGVETARKLELLQGQIDEANNGSPADLEAWRRKTEVIVRQIFGAGSPQHDALEEIRFTPSIWTDGTDFRPYEIAGVRSVMTMLASAKLEVELSDEQGSAPTERAATGSATESPNGRIFVVHGHDETLKATVESVLLKLTGDQPIILHQQANKGRTLIEKFEQTSAGAAFAVVLLTGDDRGGPKELGAGDYELRGRQNVVFEAGFFFGAVGRDRTAILFEEGVELPTDIDGVAFIPIDAGGGWKAKLATELDAAGIKVDWKGLGIA